MGKMPVNFSGGSCKLQSVLKPRFLESRGYARLPACDERERACLVSETAEAKLHTERCKKSSFRMLINTVCMLPGGKFLAKLRNKWQRT